MKEKGSHGGMIAAAVLLMLPVLYVGSYYAMLNPDEDPFSDDYRFANRTADIVFAPIHHLDKWLRPSDWGDSDLSHYGGGSTEIEDSDLTPSDGVVDRLP